MNLVGKKFNKLTVLSEHKIRKRIYSGLDMVMERAEKIGRAKTEYSLEELYMMTDIVKDSAEAFKDLAKAHKYFSEHSIERY